jgi:hypothetical protein
MEIEFDASEYELIAVAIDDYLRKLRRERRNIKQFLKKLRQLINSCSVTNQIVDERQALTLIEKDFKVCKHIKKRILTYV